MACKFFAKNGKPSILYDDLATKYNDYTAEVTWLKTRTDEFNTMFPNAELDTNGEPTISFLENMNQVLVSTETSIPDFYTNQNDVQQQKMNKVKSAFINAGVDIVFEQNDNLESSGKVMTKNNRLVIQVSPNKMEDDVYFHEGGHILVDMIGENSELIQTGINHLRNTKLWNDVALIYPELTGNKLGKEVLTTAIGIKAEQLFNEEQQIGRWKIWLRSMLNKLKDLLGVEIDVAERLALQLVNGKIKEQLDTKIAIETQYQRDLKIVNSVFQTKRGLLEKAGNVIKKKLAIYYSDLSDEEKLANPSYVKFKELETLFNELQPSEINNDIVKFLELIYDQTGLLEKRIDQVVNPTAKDIQDGNDKVTFKFLNTLIQYNETFSIIEDLVDIMEQDAELKALVDIASVNFVNNIYSRYTKVKRGAKRVTIKMLADYYLSLPGKSKLELAKREEIEREYNERFKDKRQDKNFKEDRKNYIDAKIKEIRPELRRAELQRYENLLEQSDHDISWMSRMFLDGDTIDDELINIVSEVLDRAEFDTMNSVNNEYKKLIKIVENFEKTNNSGNQQKKYDALVEDEVDLKGNKTGKKTNKLISKYYSGFYKARNESWKVYNELLAKQERGESVEDNELEDARTKAFRWVNENTISRIKPEFFEAINSLPFKFKSVVQPFKDERKEILNKYNLIDSKSSFIYDITDFSEKDLNKLKELDNIIEEFANEYTSDGKRKTGFNLELAQAINAYNERVSTLFDEGDLNTELFEGAKTKAAKKGQAFYDEWAKKNIETVLSTQFFEELKHATDILGSNEYSILIKKLLEPYKNKDGSYKLDVISDDIKQKIVEFEKEKHLDKDGNLRSYDANDLSALDYETAQAILWLKNNLISEVNDAYKTEFASQKAKGEAEFKKWFMLNHTPDYYNNYDGSGAIDKITANNVLLMGWVPIRPWTKLNPPKKWWVKKPNKNWYNSKIKNVYINKDVSPDLNGIPTSKWENPQWLEIENNTEAKQLFSYITDRIDNDDKILPEWSKLGKDSFGYMQYRLPAITKSKLESVYDGSLMNNVKKRYKAFKEGKKQDDTSFGTDFGDPNEMTEAVTGESIGSIRETINRYTKVLVNEVGQEKRRVPIYYRYRLDVSDQSFDLPTLVLLNHHMSKNYENKLEIMPQTELTLDLVKSREVPGSVGTGFSGIKYKIDKILGNDVEQIPVVKTGEDSNAAKAMESLIEDRLYGIASASGVTATRVARMLAGYTGNVTLIGNYLSAGANLAFGTVAEWMESIGGIYFNKKNLANAHLKYTTELANGQLLNDFGKRSIKSRTSLLIEKFDALSDWSAVAREFMKDKRYKALMGSHTLHFMNGGAEHMMQSILMYAVLDGIKVQDSNGNYLTVDGTTDDVTKAMSIDEAYKAAENGLVLDPRVSNIVMPSGKVEYDGNQGDTEFLVSRLIKDLNSELHGQYSGQKRSEIQRYWYGTLIMLLRKWLPRGVVRRWRGIETAGVPTDQLLLSDKFYSRPGAMRREGYYTTTTRFMWNLMKQGKQFKWEMVTVDWSKLTDYERANIKKTAFEFAMMVALLGIATAVKKLADDEEDEKTKKMWYLIAFYSHRLYGETNAFINPNQALNIIKNPSAALTMVSRAIALLYQLTTSPFEEYEQGDRKGQLKLRKKTEDLVPLFKQLDRNVEDVVSFMFNARVI